MTRTGSNSRCVRSGERAKTNRARPQPGFLIRHGYFERRLDEYDSTWATRIFANKTREARRTPTDLTLLGSPFPRVRNGPRAIYGGCRPPLNPASFCAALIGPALKHKHRAKLGSPGRSFLRTTLLAQPHGSRVEWNKPRSSWQKLVVSNNRAASIPLSSTVVLRSTRIVSSMHDRCPWWRIACCAALQCHSNDAPIFAALTSDFYR